jgi:hypothetical protein
VTARGSTLERPMKAEGLESPEVLFKEARRRRRRRWWSGVSALVVAVAAALLADGMAGSPIRANTSSSAKRTGS